ncbi:MAG: hypothetical protein IPM50_08295 [Acidobacteriota bacterium]|nr:MAG: hypothetical protein IPM50_08295 [Acidobacteriota bacterium]
MPDVLVRDVDAAVIETLRKRAVENGRSMQAEVRLLISERLGNNAVSDAVVARRIKKALSGRSHSDSEKLLREDRLR